MPKGISSAIRQLAQEAPTDLFFVSMLESGRIFAGFQCPHGPDMLSNVRLYFEKFASELSIIQAMADGRYTTGMGTVRDLVKQMMESDLMENEIVLEGDGRKINIEVRITSVKETDNVDP